MTTTPSTTNPSASAPWPRRIARWLLRALVALAALVTVLVASVAALMYSDPGRKLVARVGIDQVNALIPGTIEIDALPALNPLRVELRGVRVFDPQGTLVVRVERLAVETDFSELLQGTIALSSVRLEQADIDARSLGPRQGLIAAFVDPDAPESPPSSAPPPDVVVGGVFVENLHVRLPEHETAGAIAVTLASLRGDYSLREGRHGARVQELLVHADREGERLLQLEGRGHVPSEREPSSVELHLTSGATRLDVRGQVLLPTHEGWQTEPLEAHVHLQSLTAEHLARLLRDPELERAFEGPLALHLDATGQPDDIELDGALETAGGTLRFDELSFSDERARAVLSTSGIDLQRVRAGLPPRRVAFRLEAESQGLPPEPVKLSLLLREATLDGEALVDLDLSALLKENRAEQIHLVGTSGPSRIEVEGSADFDGSAEGEVQADLRPDLVRRLGALFDQDVTGRIEVNSQVERKADGTLRAGGRLRLSNGARPASTKEDSAGISVDRLDAKFDVRGKPPELAIDVESHVENAVLGERVIDEAELHVEGASPAWDIQLTASGGQGPLPPSGTRPAAKRLELSTDLRIEREGSSTVIRGQGQGEVFGKKLDIEVSRTSVSDAGRIASDGLELDLGGQKLKLSGALDAASPSEGLELEFGPLELERWGALVSMEGLVGTVRGRATVFGSTSVPVVEVELSGRGLGLRDKPLVRLDATARFDAQQGEAEVQATVGAEATQAEFEQSSEQLALELQGSARFSPGPNFAQTLSEASFDVELALDRLKANFVEPYLPTALPVALTLGSQVRLSGSLADPRLTTSSRLTVGRAPALTEAYHELEYAGGRLTTQLRLEDGGGDWAKLQATARLPSSAAAGAEPGDAASGPAAGELGAALSRLAPDGNWEVSLSTPRRRLRELEILSLFLPAERIPDVTTELRFEASHEPHTEPRAELSVDVVRVAPQGDANAAMSTCGVGQLELSLRARHEGANNELELVGRAGDDPLLESSARARLAVQPILEGAAPELGELDFDLKSQQLELASLPVVCERLRGQLTAQAEGKDLLGPDPSATLEIDVARFSLGSGQTVDVALSAEAGSEQARVEAQVSGGQSPEGSSDEGDASATLRAELPWSWSNGTFELPDTIVLDAEFEAHQLPIAPLLPPDGPISYATGTLDAKLRASGTSSAPELHGELHLNDVAFTATSVAQPLRGVQGHVSFDGRTVRIEHFEARDREGVLTASGTIDLEDLDAVHGDVEIEADDFPIRQQGQVVAVTNMKARAEATVTPEKTEAQLTLRDVDTWLESVSIRSGIDLAPHPEFVIDGEPASGSELAEKMADDGTGTSPVEVTDEEGNLVEITMDASDRFWIKRNDFAVKLGTHLVATIDGEDVRVEGDVVIDRGYLQLFGKVFDLTRESRLRFIGSSPPNPVLELEAEHLTGGGRQVTVRITGRADAPELQFALDGDIVPAGEAVQALFSGGRQQGDSQGADQQAKSFVGGLTAGVLATAARRELGAAAPIVMIDPGDRSGEGRVRAGFELDDIIPPFLSPIVTGAYLEGIVARESEGEASQAQTEFGALLEIYFPKNLFTAGQYGPGTTWSVDFGWRL